MVFLSCLLLADQVSHSSYSCYQNIPKTGKGKFCVKRSLTCAQVFLGLMAIQYEQQCKAVPYALVAVKLPLVLQETAASYGLGAVGSLVYLRMLNRSIDSVGGVGAALSQPRLLVPVILTATFNRCDPSSKRAIHDAVNKIRLASTQQCYMQ